MSIDFLLDSEEIAGHIFLARKTPRPKPTAKKKVLELKISSNITIGGLYYLNDPSLPNLLMFHGNAEVAESYEYFMDNFLNCRANCAVVDYRGYGFSNGVSTFRTIVEDSMPVYHKLQDWLTEKNYCNQVICVGRSLGSIPAAEIGANNPETLVGIIFSSGFADTFGMINRLLNSILPLPSDEQAEKWSNINKISKIKVPTLILHGPRDRIVPYTEGELIYDKLSDDIFKKFVPIKGANHNNTMLHEDQFFPAIQDFVKHCINIAQK